VYGLLAVASVVIAWAVYALAAQLEWPQWLVSAPAVPGAFALLYGLFDRHLWKHPWLRAVGLVQLRDVSGTYDGELVSTYLGPTGEPTRRGVAFTITQTWTRISVAMDVTSESSSSRSLSAVGGITNDAEVVRLTYVYRNEVNPAVADADMADHSGAAEIRISVDGRLTGRYWNARPRAGTIEARLRV
jgi:hypothetical protein